MQLPVLASGLSVPARLQHQARRRGQAVTASNNGAKLQPDVSERVKATDAPCIVKTKQLMAGVEGVLSLAQGVVSWGPPQAALDRAAAALANSGISAYGPCEGLPELRAALGQKIQDENGLHGYNVMVTAGANQAFTNVLLTLMDASDRIVLFTPYYFNHLMAVQMTGGAHNVVYGECDKQTWHPDLDWLERELAGPSPPKVVVIVNPCNPTGVLLSRAELERASELCRAAGCWLVMDDTYEHFVYEGREHVCLSGEHILHIFSFSKAFGMMGWRMGYIAYPDFDGRGELGAELNKIQDTIPICPTQISMHVALGAVDAGRTWVDSRLDTVVANKDVLIDALSPLGALGHGVAGGEGAIYLWAKLPDGCEDDEAVVEWLVQQHRVCLIQGTSCGCPGYIRVAFANLDPDTCREAATRLKQGLTQLVAKGLPGTQQVREHVKADEVLYS
ncbi:hypothetical protein WJX72_001946 [[Myrmecia] bisecta]|uniref:Aminotransferase class I/classII large domain-containing protein n=1 Tax=[Myrmecia] bisecta TaxID=41462 RepID=A0AAW1Q3D7_9CHLO